MKTYLPLTEAPAQSTLPLFSGTRFPFPVPGCAAPIAFVLADKLRQEQSRWRPLSVPSPLAAQLEAVSRDRQWVQHANVAVSGGYGRCRNLLSSSAEFVL
jgi:hypothetical protein